LKAAVAKSLDNATNLFKSEAGKIAKDEAIRVAVEQTNK